MREKWHVIGLRKFDYTSKKTGSSYKACNLYLTTERKGVEGVICQEVFVRADLVPADLSLGSDCFVFYNRFGSVEAVIKA